MTGQDSRLSDIARGYQRTGAEDREVTELLRDFDRAIARLNELGVDVLRLRGLSANNRGAVEDADRLREVLRAVLMEPDPIKRNQLAAPVLTNPGGQ